MIFQMVDFHIAMRSATWHEHETPVKMEKPCTAYQSLFKDAPNELAFPF